MNTLDPASLQLAAIVQSSDDAIVSTTTRGVIETWNPAAERMFGYAAADVIGRTLDIIVPEERRAEEDAVVTRIRNGGPPAHFDTTGVTRSGSRLQLSVSVSPVLTPDGEVFGVARIARDVSAQRALERDALQLAAIVNSSDDAIVSKDLNGIVWTWNPAAERMFGYTAQEIVGKSITMIIPRDRLDEESYVLGRIRAGQPVEHFDTVRQRKDGSLLDISLSVSPVRTPDGRIVGASKIARDISAQKRMARELEEANRIKDEFLATLSHELRTPLNAVLGYTRMLKTGQLSGGQSGRAIEVIERNANLLAQLVSDVLDVSGIVTGKIVLKRTRCDLASIVTAAVDSTRPTADAKGVSIVAAQSPPVAVNCDPDRFQQVFWNLLSNAVKFTPPGGRVDVQMTLNGPRAEVQVSDSGVGIRRELLPFVFQRFWQGEGRDGRVKGGLGLGLALARHFVELHGGTISAESAGEGKGATFTVTLPADRG
jgi:PAS domain S-box-containing protein